MSDFTKISNDNSDVLTIWDYVVIGSVIIFSAAIGLYNVWKTKKLKNTKDFLINSRNLGVIPLVLSTVATFLSPTSILGGTMEMYCNGIQMILPIICFFINSAIHCYISLPVYFQLNVSTVNQYVEYRFNRFLRVIPAAFVLLQNSLMIASYTYITALVLSQATGLHFWISMAIICVICIIYTALGGVAAVIWTDVLQVAVIYISIVALAVKGTMEVGSFSDIWEKNRLGRRTIFFHVEPVEDSNYTMWSIIIGNYFLSFGGMMLSQTALQRQMANRSLSNARRTMMWTTILMAIAILLVSWVGLVMYARYADCDPLLNGQIQSRDQIAALFAMEVFKGYGGLFGLFVAGILATTLSTMSSALNSVSTVALIDFIRPLAPKMSDSATILLSKILGCLYGSLVVGLTGVVQHFGNVIQVLHTVAGTSMGPTAGIFFLGFFFPWASSTGTTIGYFTGLAFGWWISIGRLFHKSPYLTGPMSTSGCNVTEVLKDALNFTTLETPSIDFIEALSSVNVSESISVSQIEIFPLYRIIPVWYTAMTMTLVIVVGLSVSIVLGPQDPQKIDPRLISPVFYGVLRMLPESIRHQIGYKWWKPEQMKLTATNNISKDIDNLELEELKQSTEEIHKLQKIKSQETNS